MFIINITKLFCVFSVLLLWSVSSYGQAGSFDPNFDGDGIATTDFPLSNEDIINAVTIGQDGKSVVVGYAKSGSHIGDYSFAVARYYNSGALDTSFNNQGFIRTWALGSSFARAVAVQPDGKIVVVGETTINGTKNFAIVRYTTTGALDPTFSDDGIQTINFGGCYSCFATSVVVQPDDGNILVAGEITLSSQSPTDVDFAIVRLKPDGLRDMSFDGDGRVTTSIGTGLSSGDHANTILLQPDGKIIVAGNVNAGYGLVRYTAAGALDSSFGSGGKAVFAQNSEYGNYANAFALQTDGKIVGVAQSYYTSMYVFRIHSDGNPDLEFGYTYQIGTRAIPKAIAVTQTGNIVAVGQVYDSTPATAILIACITPSGQLNTQFDNDGKLFTSFYSNPISIANSITIQSNGKIIVAGYTGTTSPVNYKFAVARYLMTGL